MSYYFGTFVFVWTPFTNNYDMLYDNFLMKDYKCLDCETCFYTSSALKVHIRNIHEETRNYVCDNCGQAFKRPETLKDHIKYVHDKIRNHDCQFCYKVFGRKPDLKKHIQSVHSKEMKDGEFL